MLNIFWRVLSVDQYVCFMEAKGADHLWRERGDYFLFDKEINLT